MDTIEKKVLKSICANLRGSAATNWKTGDLEMWAEHAKRMKITINDSVSLIEKLIEDDDEEDKKESNKSNDIISNCADRFQI
jgi:hypothetical protein